MYMPAYQCLEHAKWQEDLLKGNASTGCNAGKKKSSLSDKNICIVGAGGPVGLGIIDIATNAGARVYALSHSSYEKSLREIGVNGWFPLFKKSKWVEAWGGKMDLIIDMIGDFNYYSCFSDVMAPKAKFVRVNTTSSGKKYVPGVEGEKDKLSSVIRDYKGSRVNKVAIEYDVFHSFNDDQELFTEDLAYLHHLLEIGKIEPKLLSRVGFDELEQEWTKVMGGGTNGIVVVSPWKV
jgi:NADPH:quinone reductase-like Zn-dependent oxidoreductase